MGKLTKEIPNISEEKLEVMEREEHKAYHRRIKYILMVILILLLVSSVFYHYVEKWRYIDALYFTAATMTTVGYGDITPKTDIGKIFTIFYVFAGVGIALYGLSLIASHFVEVREEFWLEKLGKRRIKHHTQNFWEKMKNLLIYKPEKLTKEYNTPAKRKK